MTAIKTFVLKNSIYYSCRKISDRIMAIAKVLSFSKVDFCVIVQNKKAREINSGFEELRLKISKIVVILSVTSLGFACNNKKPTRKLHG